MFKRFMAAVALLAASSAFGQQSTAELEKRLRDLEARVAQVDELKREIDVLTREIESMKVGEKRAVAADQTNYGFGVAASKVYRADVGVSFGGYGEFAYEKPQNGVAVADALRAVLYTGYKFNDRVLFNSELEVEHGSTESAGAVSSEFAYLDFLSRPQLNYRAGLMLMPMGLVNEQHEPTAYLTTHKAVTEQAIIPATWSELGAGVFGDSGPLSYRAYVVTGLRAGGFSPEEGLREGRQGGSEALAQHGAVVGRLDWHPIEGTFVGTSLYTGKTAEGLARVSIGEVHADSRFRGLTLRGVVARASLHGDTGELAHNLNGWYGEAGYDVNRFFTPYVRYEQAKLNDKRRIFTAGAAFKPISQTILKIDWQRERHRNQANVSLGYIF